MIYDMHVHTEFSSDCITDIEQQFIKAKSLGLNKVAFTDHIDFEVPYLGYQDRNYDVEAMSIRLKELSTKYDIQSIQGVEFGYRKSYEKRLAQFIKDHHFGVILASIHHSQDLSYSRMKEHKDEREGALEYLNQLYDLVSSNLDVDIITHTDFYFRYLDNQDLFYEYQKEYSSILKKIISNDYILEFNTAALSYFGDFRFYEFILKLYKELGGSNISLGSDSHILSTYRKDFDQAKELLKKCGFDEVVLIDNRQRKKERI